uniref:DUF6598 domain-containing protein n=1 Tax=Oryza rufipogon TaxID=4529 RepID=A0A0E0QC01_ORYRU
MTEIPHAATARLFPLTPAAAQMRILRRFPRLLRRSNAAARSPAPMHRLISSPSLMASAAASWCWWSPLLARGGPVVRRVSREQQQAITETRLEAMRFSNPTNCVIRSNGTCMSHVHCNMLQILSLELAKITLDGGSVELYGYIAGSLINMEGPNRGIDMMDYALIEYDMRIKTGEQEKDDLQLIDGASMIGSGGLWNRPETICIPGDYGAVDITLSRFYCSAEATVEILISEVQSSFNLLLGCLTSDLDKEIRLFDGVISESRDLKRSVVAVTRDSFIDLKFKVGAFPSSFDQHYVSFKEKIHGYDTQEIKTDFALISVNVTWSTLPAGLK